MDDIIDELTNINLLSSVLDDTEKYLFDSNISDELSELIFLTKKIKNKIFECNINNKSIDEFDINKRRQKIIWKILFPQYWTISHTINNATHNELDKIEDGINAILHESK